MDRPFSSLAFRGSIGEAIAEAKQQKKLFVVYTGGNNEESKLLETSTWIDHSVSDKLSQYCILLYLLEGSSEASNFSAIYPQPSVPCITVVGYNGVQLWQKAGFVSADVLADILEKAWLSLHVQETTAAFFTAALAKQLASGTPETASSEQVTPNTSVTDDCVQSPDDGQLTHSQTTEDGKSHEDGSKETDLKQDSQAFAEPSPTIELATGEPYESTFQTETRNISQDPVDIRQNTPKVACSAPEKNLDVHADNLGSSNEVSREIVNEASEAAKVKDPEYPKEVEKADSSDSSAIKSNDVFLNIKMPDDSSLQAKFSMLDTLKMVKDYINQTNSLSSFSIAIPYPRKVFNEQDLDSTLLELGLINRQALVVVPHNRHTFHDTGGSSDYQTNSLVETASSNSNEGYWALLRRMVSYANPFSYLSRSPSPGSASQESEGGMWQYSPNPSLQNTLRYGGRPSPNPPSDQTTTAGGSNRRQQTSRFGANIHTLRHDDLDDSRFKDRNAFWNGNSTQYGGNEDGK